MRHSLSESTTMPNEPPTSPTSPLAPYPPLPMEHRSRAPEFYGFVALTSTYLAFALYILWALLPDEYIVWLGVTWYPSRWVWCYNDFYPFILIFFVGVIKGVVPTDTCILRHSVFPHIFLLLWLGHRRDSRILGYQYYYRWWHPKTVCHTVIIDHTKIRE